MICNANSAALTFENFGGATIQAGLIGENDVTELTVNCAAVLAGFTAYTVTLLIQLPGSTDVYPAPCTVENGIVSHTFTETELQTPGMGFMGIMISSTDGRIKKSANAPLLIGDVLTQPHEVPDEVTNWIASITSKLIPDDGVPYEELSEGVQKSLDKADSALQEADLTPYRTAADQDVIDSAFFSTTDTTLTESGKPADAYFTGDIISKATENKRYIPVEGYYIAINQSTTTFEPQSSANCTYIKVECVEGDIFTLTTKGSVYARAYCFADSSGNILEVAPKNQEYNNYHITAPENSAWLVCNSYQTELFVYKGILVTDRVSDNTKNIDELKNFIKNNEYTEETKTRTWVMGSITAGENATSTIRIRSNGYLRINPKTNLEVKVPYDYYITIYKYHGMSVGDYDGYIYHPVETLFYFEEETFVRFVVSRKDGVAASPSDGDKVSIKTISRYDVYPNYPIGLHVAPENDGVLNIVKRARKFTDIKWTPAVNLPRFTRIKKAYGSNPLHEGVFLAGKEYTGMPYSSAKGAKVERYGYTRMIPGIHTNFEAFITAISNPNTFVSKESTYDTSIMLSTMYGSTCCGLVSYALGTTWYSTEDFYDLLNGNLTLIGIVSSELDINLITLGDVIVSEGHTAIITDLIKDSGNTVYIEVSENTVTGGLLNLDESGGEYGGHAIRHGLKTDDFIGGYNGYKIGRYINRYDVSYTKSDYVNVGDELNIIKPVNLCCLPYMGENFAYKTGYLYNTDILINSSGYDKMVVTKDGEAFAEYAIDENTQKVTVGFTNTGDYEAYLCKTSNDVVVETTSPCHWRVRN